MRTLLLDIETAPNTGYFWGLFEQNIAHDQVKETSYILCWSAKWLGEKDIMYESVQYTSRKKMLKKMHNLMDQAEVIIHYNGGRFDIPVLCKEFIKAGLQPPSPYKQIDLYRVVKRVFRFESNKLDSVCEVLGLGKKTKHQGFGLWVGCMEQDKDCWRDMERYNRNDVTILERLYHRLLPWIPSHPHMGLIEGKESACPSCGVVGRLNARGTVSARTAVYQRFRCMACGSWSRSRLAVKGKGPKYV